MKANGRRRSRISRPRLERSRTISGRSACLRSVACRLPMPKRRASALTRACSKSRTVPGSSCCAESRLTPRGTAHVNWRGNNPIRLRAYWPSRLQKFKDAETEYDRAIGLLGDSQGTADLRWVLLVNRGHMRIERGDLAGAEVDLKAAIAQRSAIRGVQRASPRLLAQAS